MYWSQTERESWSCNFMLHEVGQPFRRENLPAGKQASAKNGILFMWILYSGIQLTARVPADDPTFLLGTNQGCKIPRFSSGIFGKVFVIMQPWGQFTITVRHHLSTVPLAA